MNHLLNAGLIITQCRFKVWLFAQYPPWEIGYAGLTEVRDSAACFWAMSTAVVCSLMDGSVYESPIERNSENCP